MNFLLDTNICIYLINRRSPSALERILDHKPSDIGIPAIVAHELRYGAEKSQRQDRNRRALARFLSPFEILPFDDGDATQSLH